MGRYFFYVFLKKCCYRYVITIHRNTINPFVVFKSSVDLTQIESLFLAKVTCDITQVAKVVKLTYSIKNTFVAFELEEDANEDLPNGIITLPTYGHYHFDLYTNDVYTSDVSNLTKLYTEKMYLI